MSRDYQEQLEGLLFQTGALRVAPEDKPFWYTAGTIGPYYINTHFLYGSEKKANDLLALIDAQLATEDWRGMPGVLTEKILENDRTDPLFHAVAECVVSIAKTRIDIGAIDVISGGERRDWFFSYIAAAYLEKPHLTIFKDLRMVLGDAPPRGRGDVVSAVAPDALRGKRCLHISDLITEASSYARAWEPALRQAGSHITESLTVADRLQGGGAVLAGLDIRHNALVQINAGLFERALATGYINQEQYALIRRYVDDPKDSMRTFLLGHPEFLQNALAAGGKEAQRAQLCIDKNIYGLK